MNKKEQKIHEITHNSDFTRSRTLTSLLKAIDVGVSLKEESRLFVIVQEAFKYGKKKNPSYIRHVFKKDLKFLKKEFKGIKI